MTLQTACPFAPGDVVTRRKQTYKIKSVSLGEKFGDDKTEWLVVAWRWIKKTQKYSGNAYVYSATDFAPVEVKEGPALLTEILNGRG